MSAGPCTQTAARRPAVSGRRAGRTMLACACTCLPASRPCQLLACPSAQSSRLPAVWGSRCSCSYCAQTDPPSCAISRSAHMSTAAVSVLQHAPTAPPGASSFPVWLPCPLTPTRAWGQCSWRHDTWEHLPACPSTHTKLSCATPTQAWSTHASSAAVAPSVPPGAPSSPAAHALCQASALTLCVALGWEQATIGPSSMCACVLRLQLGPDVWLGGGADAAGAALHVWHLSYPP